MPSGRSLTVTVTRPAPAEPVAGECRERGWSGRDSGVETPNRQIPVILPDINVLVYAYRREAPAHERYRSWLGGLLAGHEDIALADHSLAGFVRIVTNSRIFADPSPTGLALDFVDRLRAAPRARPVSATPATWAKVREWAMHDRGLRGNLVPDAYLGALAVTHEAKLATADRGFSRFPDVELVLPV